MRKRLARFVGQRRVFTAVFIRFGKAYSYGGSIKRYMFLYDIWDERERFVTMHMWMPMQPADYVWARLREGDVIRFSAEVEIYAKGPLKHRTFDFGLCKPRDVELIELIEDAVYDAQE